ncbi:hypothetical protein [Enterococcus faecalis]|uniref:hypothetical protein n=1 Tax=Enterococcus faecalis TaxID=1351 RepID=UPI002090748B|nr:hypothetical protein [Enterococcus faecalis]MCO5542260.1 hypothetical protein [Enterococcus faecalis]
MLEFLNIPEELVEIPSLDGILSALKHNSSLEANIKTLFCLHLAFYLSEGGKVYDQLELMDYLHKELRSFEKCFSEYIKSVENDEYRKKACELLLDITNTPLVSEIDVFTP